ncbi:MAG: hypothetical protein ACOYKI_00345 [Sediminibacterium sp.]
MLATALFACSTPAENKVETSTGTTSVTTEGPDVELMKKAAESWAIGNWEDYLSCFADTAISVHNTWAVTTDTAVVRKVSSYIDSFKKSRENMDGNVTIENSIYEVVTFAVCIGHESID